jgi:hypothetical protein
VEDDVILENEIRQLEQSVNTLVHRPTLIRRDYWTDQTEKLLRLPGLSARNRQRLAALLALLGAATWESSAQHVGFPTQTACAAEHASCESSILPGSSDKRA